MVLATGAYVINDSLMKLATVGLPPLEVLFLRGVCAAIWCLPTVILLGYGKDIPKVLDRWVLLRNGLELLAVAGFIVALANMPIADLSALGPPALRRLDVTVLHGVILGPLLGLDAAAPESQAHLAYTHDTAEALARVAAGQAQVAFFMNATKIEEVLAACEAGFVLPQKSTYFQPKLATGLVMYGLDGPAPE